MATRPSLRDAPTDIAQPMRLPPGVPTKGTGTGPVGPRPLQDPYGLLPDEPALHRYPRAGSEAKFLAKGGREGGLALGGDRHKVHGESVSRTALLFNVSSKAHARLRAGSISSMPPCRLWGQPLHPIYPPDARRSCCRMAPWVYLLGVMGVLLDQISSNQRAADRHAIFLAPRSPF